MIEVSKHKAALDTGDRTQIVAADIELVKAAGGTPKDPRPTNVSANFGADNSAEKNQIQKTFNANALGLTATFDAFNKKAGAGSSTIGEVTTMVSQLQDLMSADANLSEVERIERGDKFGTGGGLPDPGVPPWAIALKAGVNRLLKDSGLDLIP